MERIELLERVFVSVDGDALEAAATNILQTNGETTFGTDVKALAWENASVKLNTDLANIMFWEWVPDLCRQYVF